MVNTRQAAKNDYLDIMNYYREKVNDVLSKKIDFTLSFEEPSGINAIRKVKEEDNSRKYRQNNNEEFVT